MTPAECLKGTCKTVMIANTDNNQVLVIGMKDDGWPQWRSCATFDDDAAAEAYAAFLRRDLSAVPAPAPAPAPMPGTDPAPSDGSPAAP